MTDLAEYLEATWRLFDREGLEKELSRVRLDVYERRSILAFAEVNLAAGERVLEARG